MKFKNKMSCPECCMDLQFMQVFTVGLGFKKSVVKKAFDQRSY